MLLTAAGVSLLADLIGFMAKDIDQARFGQHFYNGGNKDRAGDYQDNESKAAMPVIKAFIRKKRKG